MNSDPTRTQNSYRQIAWATSLFGGVQAYQILLSLVRSKIVAILLGAQGMGIAGLLTSVTTMVSGITNLGLTTSAVRSISEANAGGDAKRIGSEISALRKLVWITGLMGTVVLLVGAPWFSRWTFGEESYITEFRILSISILLTTLSSGQYALLQGLRRLKDLAFSSIVGSTVGLMISVLFYMRWGIKGIVPAFLATAIMAVVLSLYFTRRIALSRIQVSWSEAWRSGMRMVQLGIALSVAGILSLVVGYITRIFVTKHGGLEQVGLFGAGYSIMTTYVGMIFTAMGTDYYPRLASHSSDLRKMEEVSAHQIEMSILFLGPILLILALFAEMVIVILYSKEFIGVVPFILWSIPSILLKALTWALGFVMVIRGSTGLFLINELIGNIYMLAFNLLGYHWWGLTGLGISALATYAISSIQNLMILRWRFGFEIRPKVMRLLGMQMLLSLVGVSSAFLLAGILRYAAITTVLAVISLYSYRELNRRMDLRGLWMQWKNK